MALMWGPAGWDAVRTEQAGLPGGLHALYWGREDSLFAHPVLSCCGISLGPWHQKGVSGGGPVWRGQGGGRVQPALWASGCLRPFCCNTPVVLAGRRWVLSCQGVLRGARVNLLPQIRCLFAVMNSLGRAIWRPHVCGGGSRASACTLLHKGFT